MFKALLQRKAARFREQQYLAGMTASMIWNMTPKKESRVLTPWDFVPDPQEDARRETLRKHIVAMISVAVALTTQDLDEIREKTVVKLTKLGHENVREIFEEAFPHWKWREMKEARDGSNSRNTDR